MANMSTAPLIVTLTLDDTSFSFFNSLRSAHFPPNRNYLKAHLTLFHHLPTQESSILTTLKNISERVRIFPLQVTAPALIGNGVAYKLESKELQLLHAALQSIWKDWLTPQDQQKLWPHITVQNKVPSTKAHALFEQLTNDFSPFTAYGTGLSVWIYRNGPWEALSNFPFIQKD